MRPGLDPWLGRSPGGRHGNPLQYSCLEDPVDRGAWEANSPWCCKESDTTEQLSTAQQITLEAQDLNVEQYTKVVEVVQNVIQCYHVIYDEKKRATPKYHWIIVVFFFFKVHTIESNNEPGAVPSASGMNEISACPPSLIANNTSALLSPTAPSSSSQ